MRWEGLVGDMGLRGTEPIGWQSIWQVGHYPACCPLVRAAPEQWVSLEPGSEPCSGVGPEMEEGHKTGGSLISCG